MDIMPTKIICDFSKGDDQLKWVIVNDGLIGGC